MLLRVEYIVVLQKGEEVQIVNVGNHPIVCGIKILQIEKETVYTEKGELLCIQVKVV